jgi:hypothetical protein
MLLARKKRNYCTQDERNPEKNVLTANKHAIQNLEEKTVTKLEVCS